MRDRTGFERVRRCMNCGKVIPDSAVSDLYSARFCSLKCRNEYLGLDS